MVGFQKLLHKIKELKEGVDYTFKEQELLNNQEYEKEEVYLLQSRTIKEEAQKIALGEFEKTENHIKSLQANNNFTEKPNKKDWGKYLLGRSVILGGITLIFILVIRKRKKKIHN
ncbi:MAG: hypothetical protein MRERC_9c030 [Mycoplasmataceae bacterium RC_NB112A]|nr:MAG: hypothetical protein MRERC_9c030 [Mycoplasmataceae bacterium RC_NB112A]